MAQPTDRPSLYHFKLDRILGKGGTGTVYRGLDGRTGNVVAIKLFRANFFRNRFHIRDLAKTVKKLRKFDHVNIAHIYEFISGDEGEALVMEYVDGPDLKWYLANRPWNLQERLVICAQLCNGLQYLHEQGIVHHDFKPANVLFTRKGVAKVCDYSLCGSSYLIELFDQTIHDQVTPMYIAPELIRKEKASRYSDMYSLGVTMYLMFAGKVPFEVDNLQRLYLYHLHETPLHPSDVNPKCPRILGDVIMKMLNKKPKERYKDCDEIRIAIAGIGQTRI